MKGALCMTEASDICIKSMFYTVQLSFSGNMSPMSKRRKEPTLMYSTLILSLCYYSIHFAVRIPPPPKKKLK